MATVHPSRMRMVPQSRPPPPPPPPPRRPPTPPPKMSREEELKLKLLAKRKQQHSESSGLKIKGLSKQDVEDEPLPDIYRERKRDSAEPGPSRDRSSAMHGWDDRNGDDYRRRSRSKSRNDDRYARQRSGSRSREDDTYRPRRSDSRDRRPPRYDDRHRPRSRSRERRPSPPRDREYTRNDRPPPPHLPPFPPKWDQNLPPPIAPPIRLGFGGPGPAGLLPGQGQGQGQGYQPGPGPRAHGGNGFRQGGAVDFERSVLLYTCNVGY